MNRQEAVLRELDLYPLWQRREQAATFTPRPSRLAEEVRGRAEERDAPIENRGEQAVGELNWPELKARVRGCTACKLRAGCTQTVFGVGDEKAGWLFVGEGPGADEDARGEPFVGQAGKLLDNMLAAIRLKRGKDVYIANIVKCRPPGNRAPEADEIAQCLPYLHRQIELIRPKLIVALGKTAATALLGRDAALSSLRGRLHEYRAPATESGSVQEREGSRQPPLPHQTASPHRAGAATPLVITYHPAYLLRSPLDKAKAWQDLCLAVEAMSKSNLDAGKPG